MIQGCFSNPESPISSRTKNNTPSSTTTTCSSSSSSSKESLITCIYQTQLCDTPIHLTLTWSKTPYSHTLTIHAPEFFSITVSLQPSTFSIFRTRPGSKSIQLSPTHDHHDQMSKVKLYHDFTRAEFTHPNSAEPNSRFYLALAHNGKVEFFLGDLLSELTRRVGNRATVDSGESTLLSRREHVFGRRIFATRSEFMGSTRLIEIDCSGGTLKVKFDGEMKVNVKRLAWKFRGNEKMVIDGVGVEFYWDVLNWVNNNNNNNNNNNGGNLINAQKHGVFVFQVGEGGVWPEMVGPERKLMRKNSPAAVALSPAGSCSSVLQWAEESSDCGRSSSGSSSTTRSSGSFGGGGNSGGFSLVLYAWRRD